MILGHNLHFQPIMILALLPFAIGFESTRVATSVSLMRFTSLSTFIQVLRSFAEVFLILFLPLDNLPCGGGWVYSFPHGVRRVLACVLHLRPHTKCSRLESGDVFHYNLLTQAS